MRLRRRQTPRHQRALPFLDRRMRLERIFKAVIASGTLAIILAVVVISPRLRYHLARAWDQARFEANRRIIGLEPSRADLEAADRRERTKTERETFDSVRDYYDKLEKFDPRLRHLFDVMQLDPEHLLLVSGRADNAFIVAPGSFELDHHGRNYRLKPNTRSVWVFRITYLGGPFGMFLVPDTPEVLTAANEAHASIDAPSRHTTNSWGVRGPEPNLDADLRGLVLGDSFMQGMFNGDDDTPPINLQRALSRYYKGTVDILNTGVIGYSPRQYYHTLLEYGPRYNPHFVVLSVCPNDFGDERQVLMGKGDDWDEAAYWIGEILQWCRSRNIRCLLVPIPCDVQLTSEKDRGFYPGRVANLWDGSVADYCDPLPYFVNEHLRTQRLGKLSGINVGRSALHNVRIEDGHLSPMGARLWGEIVAYRLSVLLRPPKPAFIWPSTSVTTPMRGPDIRNSPLKLIGEPDRSRPMIPQVPCRAEDRPRPGRRVRPVGLLLLPKGAMPRL